MIKTIFLFALAFPFAVFADDCSELYARHDNMNFYRQPFQSGSCIVSASPLFSDRLIYRSFFWDEKGLLMVFNSYGDGPVSQDTGARVYFFFPREQVPAFSLNGTHTLVSGAASSLSFDFDNTAGRLSILSWGDVKEDPTVTPKNNGGVEILLKKGLMLDSGYATGQDPRTSSSAKSTFIDGLGHTCKVTNKEIFAYGSNGDVDLIKTDAEIKGLLKAKCPKLVPGF